MNPRMSLPGWARRFQVIGFSFAGCLLLATSALAQVVFNVNTTDDGADADVADGKCQVASPAPPGTCTLRAAVMQANRMANAGAVIMLPPGTYNLTIPASIADGEENGDLNLIVQAGYAPGPTTITGAGAATTIIDAHGIDRVLHIDATRNVTVTGVSFVNGLLASGTAFGGGIYNQGSLTLSDDIVSHNAVGYGDGGGILNEGYLAASRVTFNDNTAQSYGGGVYNAVSGQLELSQCAVSANKAIAGAGIYNASNYYPYSQVDSTEITGNVATSFGGGVANVYGTSNLNITRSTVSNNTAGSHGGGVNNEGVLYAGNSTFSANFAKADGGGFYNSSTGNANFYSLTIAFNQAYLNNDTVGQGGGIFIVSGGTFNMRNTVVAGNTRSLPAVVDDCKGTVGFYAKNELGNSAGCSSGASGGGTYSLVNSLAEFGPLQDNGGATWTHALVPPSSMIGGGLACIDQNGSHLATDQRGRPRPPAPATGPLASTCDIGAFEYNELFGNGFQPP